MRLIIHASALLSLFFVVCANARAQGGAQGVKENPPARQETEGSFVTYVAGHEALRETYTFARQADGTSRAESEVTPTAGTKQKLTTVAARARVVSFSAEVAGTKVYEARFGDGVVKIQTAGQPDKEMPSKASVVLENLIWHQFHFLFAQYDAAAGGAQTFTCFLPSQQVEFQITVERAAAQTFALAGRPLKTTHFRLTTSQKLVIDAWLTDDGAPVLFDIPAAQVRGVRVGFEELEKLALAPAKQAAPYHAPDYASSSAYTEREVTVGAGSEWPLPGTLTVPAGKGPFPAVVLVHGSGPNDRDETLGASKPFRDLAYGLAAQGIVVLRYDKRTRVHGAQSAALPNFTVKEETIDDALAAVRLLKTTPGVDPKRIFVAGHSLGAGLAPRIIAGDADIRGGVILAGPTTPLEDAFPRQYEYLFGLDGQITEDERKFIEDARRQTARIKQLTTADLASKEMLHGAPVSYWLDLHAYDPILTALKLKQPLLVLQGERDFNVTMTDFAGWQRLAAGKRNVTTKSYPKLDHLFLEGTGPASDADYAAPRNIPRYVIADIAAFVKSP